MLSEAHNEKCTRDAETRPPCGRCEVGGLEFRKVTIAICRDARPVIVKNIPAMVCPACGAPFIAQKTDIGLERQNLQGCADREVMFAKTLPAFEFVDETGKTSKENRNLRVVRRAPPLLVG
jgi:YgiT-type zinc finger domain-containing protein